MKRRTIKIPGHPGIYRVKVFNEKVGRWTEPRRGGCFQAAIYIQDRTGKRTKKKCTFGSFKEAKAFRSRTDSVQEFLNRKEIPDQSMLFEDLVTKWIAGHLPNLEKSTQVRNKSYLKHFQFFHGIPVKDIDAPTVDRWIAFVKRDEYLALCNSTRCNFNHEFSVLKGIFRYYRERFDANFNLPFLDSHRKALKVRDRKPVNKDLTVNDLKLFFHHLKADVEGKELECLYYLALLQYGIYGRTQEAAALHAEDFDLQRGMVTVNRRIIWPRSKGSEPFFQQGLKAGESKEIPMSSFTRTALNDWKMKSGIRTGPLFLHRGKPLSYRQIEYRYTRALKAAGLPFTGTYILRHAALTECYQANKDILATKAMAGHSDLKSTQRYAKARDESLRDLQSKMDERLSQLL